MISIDVAANRPLVVRGGISHWPAFSRWNADYLKQVMGSTLVEVAVTPLGSVLHMKTFNGLSLIYLGMLIPSSRTLRTGSHTLPCLKRRKSHSMTFSTM